MHCYFDILERRTIHHDLAGIEVSDLDDAIAQARCAIAELREKEDLRARFGAGASLLVRIRAEGLLCMIPLDE